MNKNVIIEPTIKSTDLEFDAPNEYDYLEEQEERSLVKALRQQVRVKRFAKPTINSFKVSSK